MANRDSELPFFLFLSLSILLCISAIILAAQEDHAAKLDCPSCGPGDFIHVIPLTTPFASCTLHHHFLVLFFQAYPPRCQKWWSQALTWFWMVLWIGWMAVTITQGIIRQDVFNTDNHEQRWAVALVSIEAVEVVVLLVLGSLSRRNSWIGGRKAEISDSELTEGYRRSQVEHEKTSA